MDKVKVKVEGAPAEKLLLTLWGMWSDVHVSAISAERVSVHKYAEPYGATCFPRRLAMDIIQRPTPPTLADADRLRQAINQYRNSKRGPGYAARCTREVAEAIALLKRRGYRVMKRMVTYEEV